MSFRENVASAVTRMDLMLTAMEGLAAYTGPDSIYSILRSCAQMHVDGDLELRFDGGDLFSSQSGVANGTRAVGAPFNNAELGTVYQANLTPNDLGKRFAVDWADKGIKQRMRLGRSQDDIREWYFQRSYSHFIEQIEINGVAGFLGNGTTPFEDADLNVQAALTAIAWDAANSNPISDVQFVLDFLAATYGVVADTLYMGRSVFQVLRQHPRLVELYGGNVGVGQLGIANVASALGVRQIFVGATAGYTDFVTVCTQRDPGQLVVSNEHGNTLFYGFDPEPDTGEYGIQFSSEGIPGTMGRGEWATAHAFCGLAVNPIGGRRLSNCLT